MRKLTDAFISSIEAPASGRLEIADTVRPGLVLRVTPAGVRTFSYRYRTPGVGVNRFTLGTYPKLGLGAARARVAAIQKEGGDPAAERREQRSGGRLFSVLADRYIREHAKRKKRSWQRDERNLAKHVLPKWGKRDYLTITRGDVIALIEGLASTPVLANRIHSLISTVFSFAIDCGLRDDHPCHRLAKRFDESERAGKRVLSNAELPLFWKGIVCPPEVRLTGLGLRLALLTGARISEVAGLSRAELENIESATNAAWVIPGARTKNKKDHLIPLAPLARQTVLDVLAMIEPGEQFLFPTRSKRRSGAMRGNTFWQSLDLFGNRIEDDAPGAATWRADAPSPHDLRRTVETRMAALGVPKEHRDRCLNHIPVDVGSRHYDKHDYRTEKLAAFSRWEGALTAILSGGAVVALADRRAAS